MPTRYTIPKIKGALARPRLFALFDLHRHINVFSITGQAAQGKSTLVASYLERLKEPCLWFHLTNDASNHTTLFDILMNGLQQLFGDQKQIREIQFPQITLGTRDDLLRQVQTLITIFSHLEISLNVVLDDLETLGESASSYGLIEHLIQSNPGNIRFYFLSRTLPPIKFQRLKMEQDVLVLTNEDLAFDRQETQLFFLDKLDLENGDRVFSTDQIDRIYKITDGWAGGLVLVSESFRHSHDLNQLPDRLSSQVFSYFSREIYQTQASHVQEFLMKTAVLDLLDTRVLSIYLEKEDSCTILKALEKRNLFIQKIDSDLSWPVYKYNNLFRDFLKTDLQATLGHKEYQRLNRLAGQIYWDRKAHEEAIRYFMEASAFLEMARIIRIKGIDYVITGRVAVLAEWLNAMPEALVREDPWLLFFKTMTRRIKGGRKNLQSFEDALILFKNFGDTRGNLLCTAYLIEAAVFVRQPSQVILKWIQAGEVLLKELKGSTRYAWARTLLWQQIGLGYIAGNGNIPKGISACQNAILLANRIDSKELLLNTSVILTFGLVQSGDFAKARQMINRIQEIAKEGQSPEYRALKRIVNIDYALKKGEFDLAGSLLEKAESEIDTFGLIFLYPGFVEARANYYACVGNPMQALQTAEHLSDFSVLEGNDFYLGISHRIKAMSYLLDEKYDHAKISAEKAIHELDRSKRGDIHLFQARQIFGFALFYIGSFKEARVELESVIEYFSLISMDLNFCETSFITGLAAFELGDIVCCRQHLEEGLQKAIANQYACFPLISAMTLARVIVTAEYLGLSQGLELFKAKSIQENISPLIQDEITSLLFKVSKKERMKQVDHLKTLYRLSRPKIRITTLGEFKVLVNGKRLSNAEFEGAKPKSLLKAIVLNGSRSIPKEILIDSLWPDADAASGEKNFKINLHRLRKALEPEPHKDFGYSYISMRSSLVSLDSELVFLDIDEFMMLSSTAGKLEAQNHFDQALNYYQKAAELYQGDYFSEEPYLDWINQRRDLFRSRYIEILRKKALLHEDLDQWQEAVETWRSILGTNPFFETAYRNLMILYADAGRKTEALHLFKECREVLKRELDTHPEPETFEIYHKIRTL